MQLYHGLPIITNKVSQQEMKGIPHHLLGYIGLEEDTWTAGKFVSNALRTVRNP
jgi:tRNA dimethylallyltransferase